MTDKRQRRMPDPIDSAPETPPAEAPAEAASVAGLPVEPPEEAVLRLERELDAAKDRHLRVAAEYENFRKRSAKERAEVWVKAQADLVRRLVDALDDLSRFAHVDPSQTDAPTIHAGVELVERKFWKELEAAGVRRIDELGVPFDPRVHEAVTTAPADDPAKDHTVGAVLQAGYVLGDVLLRPARVAVLTAPDA